MEQWQVALIGSGIALIGAVMGSVVTYLTNRQRATHELEALERRFAHEERERSVKLKLESIERAYELLSTLMQLMQKRSQIAATLLLKDEQASDSHGQWQNDVNEIFQELSMTVNLYIPDITTEVNLIGVHAFMLMGEMAHLSLKTATAVDVDGTNLGKRHAELSLKVSNQASAAFSKLSMLVKRERLVLPSSAPTPVVD